MKKYDTWKMTKLKSSHQNIRSMCEIFVTSLVEKKVLSDKLRHQVYYYGNVVKESDFSLPFF